MAALALWCGAGMAQTQDFALTWGTIDGGGGAGDNGFFRLEATLGQPDAGVMSDGFYQIEGGFWSGSLASPPVVSVDPASAQVNLGDALTLRADATGSGPFRYQWRLNGVNLLGATNDTLSLSNIQLESLGAYSVVVVNEFGVERSEPSDVLANLPRLLSADDFADRTVIPQSTPRFYGDNRRFTFEPNEPLHAGKLGGRSAWYDWTSPSNGIATFQTTGATFDSLLAVYEGKSLETLVPVAGDDDRGGFLTSAVRFNAEAGATYRIAVDGLGARGGSFLVSWELEVTSQVLPVLTSVPAGRAVPLGGTTLFAVAATGAGLSYQWTFNGADLAGEVSGSLMIANAQLDDVGHYAVRVTNADGRTVESPPAALEIGPVPSAVSHNKFEDLILAADLAGVASPLTSLTGTGSGLNALPGVIPVSVGPIQQQNFDNLTSSNANECVTACGVVGGAAQWIGLRPDLDGVLRVDTLGSDFDCVLYVYEAALDICDFLVACDTDGAGDEMNGLVSFAARAGTTYIVVVDGENGEHGQVQLNWQLCQAPPPFLQEPDGFYVVTDPNPQVYPEEPHYTWLRDGAWLAETLEPILPLDEPPAVATRFSVYYTTVTDGEFHVVTNELGYILKVGYEMGRDGEQPVFRMILPGVSVQPFQVQRADTTLTDCHGGWLWLTETNYTANLSGQTMTLSLPMAAPAGFYRVRPLPSDHDSP